MADTSTASSAAETLALAQALRLASPALPVGGFSYSQGMEWAVEAGRVHDEPSAQDWIVDGLLLAQSRFELPLLLRLLRANADQVTLLDATYLAAREAREPHEESLRMGHALNALLNTLPEANSAESASPASWPAVFARACRAFAIPERTALTAYTMAWSENQTAAAVKLVPLGQSAAQRILSSLIAHLPDAISEAFVRAVALQDDNPISGLDTSLPALAIACAKHETQYTRLFRS